MRKILLEGLKCSTDTRMKAYVYDFTKLTAKLKSDNDASMYTTTARLYERDATSECLLQDSSSATANCSVTAEKELKSIEIRFVSVCLCVLGRFGAELAVSKQRCWYLLHSHRRSRAVDDRRSVRVSLQVALGRLPTASQRTPLFPPFYACSRQNAVVISSPAGRSSAIVARYLSFGRSFVVLWAR